ncbi:MAG: DUF423 domain-containing protein [Halobacteriovoraceae bacterium]|nr:DUF423 domain-containing protein [Halobacteriovoraceae bacterium]
MDKTRIDKFKFDFVIFCLLMFLAVALGAFGAHGLESKLTTKMMKTYHTGNQYHYYMAFSYFMVSLLKVYFPNIKIKIVKLLIIVGLFLFSGCCYLYALSGLKFLVILVPLGGTAFLAAWPVLAYKISNEKVS